MFELARLLLSIAAGVRARGLDVSGRRGTTPPPEAVFEENVVKKVKTREQEPQSSNSEGSRNRIWDSVTNFSHVRVATFYLRPTLGLVHRGRNGALRPSTAPISEKLPVKA